MASGALKIAGLLGLCWAASSVMAQGMSQVVYQHSGSGNFSYTTGAEYGDEVIIPAHSMSGVQWVITGFSFEYSANYALPGGLTFRIYEQNGAPISGFASPGTEIYETTVDINNGGGVVDINFTYDATNILPNRLTYTVQFDGLVSGNTAGLIIPGGTPVIGASGNDFWEKTGPGASDWALKTFTAGSPSANFVATITAVPEPSTVAMMVAGAGLVLVALRRK
jgi:PEP-CTERM motif